MPSPRSASEVFESFRSRFAELDTSSFDATNEADASFVSEVEHIAEMFSNTDQLRFAGAVMAGVQNIAKKHGTTSEQYVNAIVIVKDLMEKTVIPNFLQSHGADATVAVLLSPPVKNFAKRSLERRQTTTNSTNSYTACPKTQADCNSAFNSCSGRGECKKDWKNCYVCVCGSGPDSSTSTNEVYEWSGPKCQHRYTGPEFFFLFGTAVMLLLFVLGITVLLQAMGGPMDSGPMVALSGPAGIKTD